MTNVKKSNSKMPGNVFLFVVELVVSILRYPKILTFFENKEVIAMEYLAEKLNTGRAYFFPILNGHGDN